MASDEVWQAISKSIGLSEHNFTQAPLNVSAKQIKVAVDAYVKNASRVVGTSEREVRTLCKQDTREDRPKIFKQNDLFLLPVRNGEYVILRGDGYVDIPAAPRTAVPHSSVLSFVPQSSFIGNSEMQHLDYAYATSVLRTFCNDPNLVLTIRGRKYSGLFTCTAGGHSFTVESVQTEVDGGYESDSQIVLIEAKPEGASNTIIRQLYYPFRQWSLACPNKKVRALFFSPEGPDFLIWEFGFSNPNDYHSVHLVQSSRIRVP